MRGCPREHPVWMSHGDCVTEAPEGLRGHREHRRRSGGRIREPRTPARRSAVPPRGGAFTRTARRCCGGSCTTSPGCGRTGPRRRSWTSRWSDPRSDRRRTGPSAALSGGVDSAVAAALVHRAIGDQLTCVFVDHGLLRAGEARAGGRTSSPPPVSEAGHGGRSERFLSALAGVTDPEQKRKIIGREFIRVFEQAAPQRPAVRDVEFLVQGTLYPDVVESGGGAGAANIKSHHNVGGLPDDLQFSWSSRCARCSRTRFAGSARARPARDDRAPAAVPGAGLGIRIIGEVTGSGWRPAARPTPSPGRS
jgi:GMP synthase (glutamine-hydrolysing)